uniref:G_PROTEIN_RECEP_F1_2 domain-containing protein n=1 Tax=Ascaris lumbricoides TaxID=6252 RepID=A0A0M3HRG9_ASCLU
MHGVVESNPELFQTLKGAALTLLVLWTIAANSLVFIVLYKNPRLQTVPNLLVRRLMLSSNHLMVLSSVDLIHYDSIWLRNLCTTLIFKCFLCRNVGNLAFSDLCLGLIVLPLSSVYAIAGEWLFTSTLCVVFVSADILCSTASIWNLSIVGLDRYWAITSPVAYMSKRNKRTAGLMILSVWISSALISLAPLLGWKQIAERGNMVQINGTWQCVFLDLPSYTIYSATGSFFIPTIVMFFVYFKIYQAFAKHRARQIYRQKVVIVAFPHHCLLYTGPKFHFEETDKRIALKMCMIKGNVRRVWSRSRVMRVSYVTKRRPFSTSNKILHKSGIR